MRFGRFAPAVACSSVLALAFGCSSPPPQPAAQKSPQSFLEDVNREMLRLGNAASRAGWVQSTYITPDTETMAAEANEAMVSAATRYAKESATFQNAQVPATERRQLELLRTSLTMSAPPDPKEAEELTRLVTAMEGAYGRGKY